MIARCLTSAEQHVRASHGVRSVEEHHACTLTLAVAHVQTSRVTGGKGGGRVALDLLLKPELTH